MPECVHNFIYSRLVSEKVCGECSSGHMESASGHISAFRQDPVKCVSTNFTAQFAVRRFRSQEDIFTVVSAHLN